MKFILIVFLIISILEFLYIIILDSEVRSIYSNFRKAIRNIENKLFIEELRKDDKKWNGTKSS